MYNGLRRLCWTAILLSVLAIATSGGVAYVCHLERVALADQLRDVAALLDAAAVADNLRKAAEDLRRLADGLEK